VPLFSPVWDLVLYLGIVQASLLWWYARQTPAQESSAGHPLSPAIVPIVAVTVFWLVWGGYGIDAWRTLARFDNTPRLAEGEPLFWFTGHLLGTLVADPWPFKIFSAAGALILIVAYAVAPGNRHTLPLSLLLLLAVPGFMLLYGNAVRQGVAGSLVVLAFAIWLCEKRALSALVALLAIAVHSMAVIPICALAAAAWLRKWFLAVFVASYFFHPVATLVTGWAGIDPGSFIRYANFTEGNFHFVKVGVAGMLASATILSLYRHPDYRLCSRNAYVFLVAICNCLLFYEVPFERALLFADLVLPLAAAEVIDKECRVRSHRLIIASAFSVAAVLVWSSAAVTRSLGYS